MAAALDFVCAFLDVAEDLVELGREQVQGGHDSAVGAEVVLLHDFGVVDRVADVNVGLEGQVDDGGVEVEDVGRLVSRVEVRVDALHEGGCVRGAMLARESRTWDSKGEALALSRASHSDDDHCGCPRRLFRLSLVIRRLCRCLRCGCGRCDRRRSRGRRHFFEELGSRRRFSRESGGGSVYL